ncbi:MAG TPA: hypothetical protein VN832_01325 [Stellaceae bacterium]|nr:hypothetical protein [Stellaceae bacterium]
MPSRARDIALKAQERATQALARLEKHEAVCEERQGAILATLAKLEGAIHRLWWLILLGAGTLICGMASLIVLLIFHQRA